MQRTIAREVGGNVEGLGVNAEEAEGQREDKVEARDHNQLVRALTSGLQTQPNHADEAHVAIEHRQQVAIAGNRWWRDVAREMVSQRFPRAEQRASHALAGLARA